MEITKQLETIINDTYQINILPLSDFCNVDNFVNGSDLSLINVVHTQVKTGHLNSTKTFTNSSAIPNDIINQILENPELSSVKIRSTSDNSIMFVRKDYKTYFAKYGHTNNMLRETHLNFIPRELFGVDNIMTCAIEMKASDNKNYEFLQAATSPVGHLTIITDSMGQDYTSPIYFGLCECMTNGEYHLDELVDYLSTRSDIVFKISDYGLNTHLQCPLTGNEEDIDEIISNIPHYNADEENTEEINFYFQPDHDTIQKLKSYDGTKYYSVQKYIASEILPLNQFKVIKNQVAEKQKKRKYKN